MNADTTPTPSGTPSYGFDNPADNAIAHQIASKDPVRDLQGPVKLTGGNIPRLSEPTLAALSPEMRAPIQQKLSSMPSATRAAEEKRLVGEALRSNSLRLRVQGGGGEGADPYWQETLLQEHRQGELQNEIYRIDRELADVERWDTVYDEATGTPSAKAVERIQGARRKEMESERNRLLAEMEDLNGRGGQLRLKKAMEQAVERQKEVRQQLEDDAEARRRAVELNREERINKRAEAYAKNLRSNVS